MCGIIGIIGKTPVAQRLLDGLRRLEYRGYDSAGICTLVDGALNRRRAEGKLGALADLLVQSPLAGTTGIAHTRWATHGAPTENNAHPHATEDVAIVHNGIIENFRPLRAKLQAAGRTFTSDTDSEVVAHLICHELQRTGDPAAAVSAALKQLEGAFALAILFRGRNDLMIGARRGSPLVVGYSEDELYLGSDAIALAGLAREITYLDEGDWVVLDGGVVTVHDRSDAVVDRGRGVVPVSAGLVDKGNYRHFMLKEIHEQPTVVAQTLSAYLNTVDGTVALPDLSFDLAAVEQVTIVACGTSYYAGMVGKYWIEQLARVPVELDIASEFRYREPVLRPGGLALFISQSGETADTLAALRHCKAAGQRIAAIVNVPTSTMAREADVVLPTHAGPEIGVASTKAFTCQLAVLAAFAAALGRAHGRIDASEERRLADLLTEVPSKLNAALALERELEPLAQEISKARDVLYLGRGTDYPLAMEGALKLKEISYIHAEGYAAGEMKHGPIALIDADVPVIVIAPSGPLMDKTVSNMQEVIARGGQVVLISDASGVESQREEALLGNIAMPAVDPFIVPLVYAVPIQLLAYLAAVAKGTDVDQPRNLAKSVTVE